MPPAVSTPCGPCRAGRHHARLAHGREGRRCGWRVPQRWLDRATVGWHFMSPANEQSKRSRVVSGSDGVTHRPSRSACSVSDVRALLLARAPSSLPDPCRSLRPGSVRPRCCAHSRSAWSRSSRQARRCPRSAVLGYPAARLGQSARSATSARSCCRVGRRVPRTPLLAATGLGAVALLRPQPLGLLLKLPARRAAGPGRRAWARGRARVSGHGRRSARDTRRRRRPAAASSARRAPSRAGAEEIECPSTKPRGSVTLVAVMTPRRRRPCLLTTRNCWQPLRPSTSRA